MANAPTKSTTSAEYGRPAEELQRARRSTMEHLQQASVEIDEARQEATGGVRRSLDSALERLREVSAASCASARRIRPLSGRTPSNGRPRRSAARWAAAPSARSGHPRRWRAADLGRPANGAGATG
jgi:hypothetical protein